MKRKGKWVRVWTGSRQKWAGRAFGAAGPFIPTLDAAHAKFFSKKNISFAAKAGRPFARVAGPAGLALNVYAVWNNRKKIWQVGSDLRDKSTWPTWAGGSSTTLPASVFTNPEKMIAPWASKKASIRPRSSRYRRRAGTSRRRSPYCTRHSKRHWCTLTRRKYRRRS